MFVLPPTQRSDVQSLSKTRFAETQTFKIKEIHRKAELILV